MKHQRILSCEVQECPLLDVFKNRSEEHVRNEIIVIVMLGMTHPQYYLPLEVSQ